MTATAKCKIGACYSDRLEVEAIYNVETLNQRYRSEYPGGYMNRILEQIKPETAELLAAQARALGLSVDDYLRTLLPPVNGQGEEKPLYETASQEEWTRAFHEWATSHKVLPVIADDSRESIYEGRGE